jgi:hypothetical protein
MNKKAYIAGGCFWVEKVLNVLSQDLAYCFEVRKIVTRCTVPVRDKESNIYCYA